MLMIFGKGNRRATMFGCMLIGNKMGGWSISKRKAIFLSLEWNKCVHKTVEDYPIANARKI